MPAMTVRRVLPLALNISLVLGMTALAWMKLTHWRGFSRAAGTLVALAYVTWALWEMRVSIRDSRSRSSARTDKWTLEGYAVAQGATALSAMAIHSRWPAFPGAFMLTGAVLFGAGLTLRLMAVRKLGVLYSHRVRITSEHRIVRTGPYAWLRHPAYAGMLLAHLGLVLVFFNWVSMAFICVALAPMLVLRILVEERTIESLPGYSEFCQGRARLIPLVW